MRYINTTKPMKISEPVPVESIASISIDATPTALEKGTHMF